MASKPSQPWALLQVYISCQCEQKTYRQCPLYDSVAQYKVNPLVRSEHEIQYPPPPFLACGLSIELMLPLLLYILHWQSESVHNSKVSWKHAVLRERILHAPLSAQRIDTAPTPRALAHCFPTTPLFLLSIPWPAPGSSVSVGSVNWVQPGLQREGWSSPTHM